MLTAHHLHKSYNIQAILQDISFSINADERIGLIGPNGCGKTTLMRILAGVESPDSGTLTQSQPNLRIGYLAQGADFSEGQTLQSALQLDSVKQEELESEIAALASALANHPNDLQLQQKYDAALQRISTASPQPATMLTTLGLADIALETPVTHLSGGQKTRLMLACVLMAEPQLLLLDEPTNHLDIEMLEWLESWLESFRGAALIISHDRTFLDNTVESILDMNPVTHTLCAYKGNYTQYLQQYLEEQNKKRSAYRDQEYKIRRMKQDINRTKQQSLRVEMTTTPRQPGVRRIAKKVAAKAKSRERKLDRYLESEGLVEKPIPSWQMKLELELEDNISRNVLVTENLSIGCANDRPILADLYLQIRAGQRIALTGPNGAGKTTLLRTIAGNLEPIAGNLRLGASIKLGYMAQEQELLDPNLSALQMIQGAAHFNETAARSFLHYFLFEGDDPLRPASELSFGERARLELGLLVAKGSSFLLLDEPINHLDIPSRTRFEQALHAFKGTILAVVHDRFFIEQFASEVWIAEDGRLQKYKH